MGRKSEKIARKESRTDRRDLLVTVLVAAVAATIVFVVGAPDRWLSAIYCTVPTFLGTISYFRKSWSEMRFWTPLSAIFILHLGLMWLIFGVLLRNKVEAVGFLLWLPFIFLEAFFIYRGLRLFQP